MQLRLFLAIALITLFSCKSSKQSDSREYPVVMMERTICFGGCPEYLFNVYPDGYATYEGKSNVAREGKYQATLSVEQLEQLKSTFEEAQFMEFANVYSANVTDLPTTYIYYHDGKNGHKVTDYFGAPDELKALEKQVDEFIETLDWIKQ